MSGILFDSKTGKYQRNINESTAYIYYTPVYNFINGRLAEKPTVLKPLS